MGSGGMAGPPAQAGVRLEAPRDITELVDMTCLVALPGAHRLSQFIVYGAACPDGTGAVSAAHGDLACTWAACPSPLAAQLGRYHAV
jgi:hypothetical protein